MASDKERGSGSASAEIGKYLEILAKDPNSRVFAPLAEAYRKAGLLDDAIETALEGLNVHPNYLGGRVALGRAYFEKKQFAEAAAEMKKVVASAPDNLMAHKILGQIAYAQHDLPSAEKSFRMVLLLDPRDQEAQQTIANIGGARAPAPPIRPAAAAGAPPPPVSARPPALPAPPPVPIVQQAPAPSLPPDEIAIPAAPAPAPRTSNAAPFDEMQPLDDLDLGAGDLFDDVAPPPLPSLEAPLEPLLDLAGPEPGLPPPVVPRSAPPIPPEPPPVAADRMQVESFNRVPWGAQEATASEPPPPPSPPPSPPPAPNAPPEEEESPFEVFGRPKRGGPPPSTKGESMAFREIEFEQTAHAPVPDEPKPDAEPVFEVFTRDRGPRTPPPPAKAGRGQRPEPREIEIETTAFTPPESFEPVPDAPEVGLEIESTSHAAHEPAAEEVAAVPEVLLEDELPPIDLVQEVREDRIDEGLDQHGDAGLPPIETEAILAEALASAAEAVLEPESEAVLEPESEAVLEPESEAVPEAESEAVPEAESEAPEPEPEAAEPEPELGLEPMVTAEAAPEFPPESPPEQRAESAPDVTPEPPAPVPDKEPLAEVILDEEIPNIDLTEEVEEDQFEGDYAESAREEAGDGASRGVFDTETLATIYVNQGFYGRAADIYRRLIEQRPADEQLRAKLEWVLDRERVESGQAEQLAAPLPEPELAPAPEPEPEVEARRAEAVPAAPAPAVLEAAAPDDSRIRQLQTLLEAFRGGRPR